MVKRAFIIHGWAGEPEQGWKPWLRDQLISRGFTVSVPLMPDAEHPKVEEWTKHIKDLVGAPDKECYLIGHSLGCPAILRYIETLEDGEEIGGVVLVAGPYYDIGNPEIATFLNKPFNWAKIKEKCKKFIAIHSDNDPHIEIKHADLIKEKIGAEVIIKHNMKHFSGHEGFNELPIALDSVLKLSE